MILTVKNNASLQALLKEHKKVILMCKAAFVCQPCNIAYPIFEELHKKNLDTDILFIDMKIQLIEDVTPTPKAYPTFIIFKDGVEVERVASSQRASIEGLLNKLKDESVQPQPTIASAVAVPTGTPSTSNTFLSEKEVNYLKKEFLLIQGGESLLAIKNSYVWIAELPEISIFSFSFKHELTKKICDKHFPKFKEWDNLHSFQLTNAENYELLGIERKEVNGKLEKLNVVNIACIWLTDGSAELETKPYEFISSPMESKTTKVKAGELLFLDKYTKISGIVLHKNMIG